MSSRHPKPRISTLASALRALRKQVQVVPVADDAPEETVGLRIQRSVDPDKWGVASIETWSADRGRLSTKQVWKEMIHYLSEENGMDVSFPFFMDGIQRTTPIGRIRLRKTSFETVPIHLAQIGTVLLKRSNRELSRDREEIRIVLEYPNSFVQSETNVPELKTDLLAWMREMTGDSIITVDTSYRVNRVRDEDTDTADVMELDGIKYPRIPTSELWDYCTDPAKFRSQARRWTTRYRDLAEQRLYDTALERLTATAESGGTCRFVVKDGPLTHARGGVTRMALGVIKSFTTIFLERSQMTEVLGLPYGYRSPVFTKTRPEGDLEEAEIYDIETADRKLTLVSWYLRVRPVEHHDAFWGLLRIEMHADVLPCKGHAGRWEEADTRLVNEISRRLSLEVSPTSHPDPRWHNLIYPIKCCEFFLRSRILPHLTAHHLLGGL